MRRYSQATSSSSPAARGDDDEDDNEAPPDYKDNLAHQSSRDVGSVLDPDGSGDGRVGPAGDGDDDGGGSVEEGEEGEVYRLYKRRWFGLVAIVFLNIIASWDVSWDPSFS